MTSNKWKAALLGLLVAASTIAVTAADARTRYHWRWHVHHRHPHHRVVNTGGYG
jgi:hypothetical protein